MTPKQIVAAAMDQKRPTRMPVMCQMANGHTIINTGVHPIDYFVDPDLWADCLILERMWLAGELDDFVKIETEELEIARTQPWGGASAVIASDGLFSFGAHPEAPS